MKNKAKGKEGKKKITISKHFILRNKFVEDMSCRSGRKPKSISRGKKKKKNVLPTMVSFHLELCGMREEREDFRRIFFHGTGSKWGRGGGGARGGGRETYAGNTPQVRGGTYPPLYGPPDKGTRPKADKYFFDPDSKPKTDRSIINNCIGSG